MNTDTNSPARELKIPQELEYLEEAFTKADKLLSELETKLEPLLVSSNPLDSCKDGSVYIASSFAVRLRSFNGRANSIVYGLSDILSRLDL